MRKYNNRYVAGDYNTICDACGVTVRGSQTRLQWNKLRVCIRHWEPKPKIFNTVRPDPKEGSSIPTARPLTTPTYIDPTIIINQLSLPE